MENQNHPKSGVDALIEELNKRFIKNGWEPIEMVEKTGSFVTVKLGKQKGNK